MRKEDIRELLGQVAVVDMLKERQNKWKGEARGIG